MRAILTVLAAATTAISLAGCQLGSPQAASANTIKSAEDAANIYVSAYPAVPWTDIADKLEPKHELKTKEAVALAATTTQLQTQQFSSTLAAVLAARFPGSGQNPPAAPGQNADQAQGRSAGGAGNDGKASESGKSPAAPGVDANTLLTAGTALYQQAQILDHQISKGLLPEGYQAHLLTLQVNVQPKQRTVSYDAYLDVSFLPASWNEALTTSKEVNERSDGRPPVAVYPLIIMDSLETTNVARSIEVVRQAAL